MVSFSTMHIKLGQFLLFQSDITDVNDIFKDLGMMVHDQGDMIGKLSRLSMLLTFENVRWLKFTDKNEILLYIVH